MTVRTIVGGAAVLAALVATVALAANGRGSDTGSDTDSNTPVVTAQWLQDPVPAFEEHVYGSLPAKYADEAIMVCVGTTLPELKCAQALVDPATVDLPIDPVFLWSDASSAEPSSGIDVRLCVSTALLDGNPATDCGSALLLV